jgi:uncharacterized protein (TIGR03437 family)
MIAGTPFELGTFVLQIDVSDVRGAFLRTSISLRVESNGPVFLTKSFPPASLGANYLVSMNVLANSPVLFSMSEGKLPRGLELSASGQLAGTPIEIGSFVLSIRATDSMGRYTDLRSLISVAASVTAVQMSSLAPARAVIGLTYSHMLSAFGGIQPYQWSLVSGRLPNGLNLATSTGRIFGSPHSAGVFTFSVDVRDQSGSQSRNTFEIVVAQENVLPMGQVGKQYGAALGNAFAQNAQFRLSSTSNRSFPQGLTLTTDGQIFGTPTIQGIYSFNAIQYRADGSSTDSAWTIAVLDSDSKFKISTLSLPAAVVGRQYSQLLHSDYGVGRVSWSIKSGNLPAGLKLDQSGVMSGIPAEAGTAEIVVEARDSAGSLALSIIPLFLAQEGGPTVASITDAASYAVKGVSPGQLISIFGSRLGFSRLIQAKIVNGVYPTEIAATKVLFDGIPVPLVFVSSGQICAIAPLKLKDNTHTNISIEYEGWRSTPISKRVYASLPGIFVSNGSGSGPVAALNENGTANSASNPAKSGSIAVMYLNGSFGHDPDSLDGSIANSIKWLRFPIQVIVGGSEAEVSYAGAAPGLITGITQVNFRIPKGLTGNIPVSVKARDETSPSGPTISVQ